LLAVLPVLLFVPSAGWDCLKVRYGSMALGAGSTAESTFRDRWPLAHICFDLKIPMPRLATPIATL